MKKAVSIFLSIIVVGMLSLNGKCSNNVPNDNFPSKNLLVLVADNSTYDEDFINKNPTITYDIIKMSELAQYNPNNYDEIAAPYLSDGSLNDFMAEQYENEKKVYLYGEFTLNDFCDVLDIQKYSVEVPITRMSEDYSTTIRDTVTMSYSDTYAEEEIQNVVALKKNSSDGLLAFIPKNSNEEYSLDLLLSAVFDDVSCGASTYATLVSSGYNIKTYTLGRQYAILDWYLYKCSENDASRDYYGIKTNIGLEGGTYSGLNYLGEGIYVNMACVYGDDELQDAAPGNSTKVSNFNVSLNFGTNISGSLGWNFSIDNNPTVSRTLSLNSDTVNWSVEEKTYTLDGQVFSPGMTWSTLEDHAALDIEFRGYFESTFKGLYDYTPWKTVQIRYEP
ncbi:MAG: hypothetical protein IJA54_04320 [Tyzzerella sp.]|nr:hypothetical protein [Tyzzerella sp.]